MKSHIAKLGLTALVSLMAAHSFAGASGVAGGGQIGSAETITGTYLIDGPTNDPGDENAITFSSDGTFQLYQRSAWGNLTCEGKFQVQSGLLTAIGSCIKGSANYGDFEMSIDMTEVSNLGYFSAPVANKTIYSKPAYMRFLRKK